MRAFFEKICNDRVFHNISKGGVSFQLCRRFDAQQVADKARIKEIKLGRFDDSFIKIVAGK